LASLQATPPRVLLDVGHLNQHLFHGDYHRMAVTLTEAAAGEVKRYMASQNVEQDYFLRMGIAGGGCAGVQYSLGFANDFDPKIDARYEQHGVTVVTTKKMALHLDGTTIDFQDGPMGRGFAIENPNIPRGGGCPGCGHH
jgi:iron-sulfur cluster assembly protein